MGNGLPKSADLRVMRRMISYKQLLADVKRANQLSPHFPHPTGFHLHFEPVTNVDHHELLPVVWRFEGKLLIIARPFPVPSPEGKEDDIHLPRALTIHQFYHLFLYLNDNFPLLQLSKSKLSSPSLPPHSSPSPSPDEDDDSKVCSICCAASVEIALPCLHAFCRECIEGWQERDATCPLCRVKMEGVGEEVWVMDSGNEQEVRELIDSICAFVYKYIEDKPEFVG